MIRRPPYPPLFPYTTLFRSGPFTAGPTVDNVREIEQLAELGVVLLLFSLGLELSFRELAPVRTVALAGATLQIQIGRAHVLNSSHSQISYAVFCLKKKSTQI